MMRFYYAGATVLVLLGLGHTALAEDNFVSAHFSEQLENGVAISGALSTIDTIEPEDGVYRVTGALYSSELGASELTVLVPTDIVDGFSIDQGIVESENTVNYSYTSAEGIQKGTTYHFLRVVGLVDDQEYQITVVDDPHPCLAKVAVGAMFVAVCGGLHVYNMQSECGGGGVEFSLFGLSCSAQCAES